MPHLRILGIFCQHFVAFDHRDQKARGLFWNQVAADRPQRLPPPQRSGNCFLQVTEDPFQSLAELFVEPGHFLRQIDQRTTVPYVFRPSWYRLHNTDQSIDWVLFLAASQRKQPPVGCNCCDNLFDNGVSQSFLAFEMVVERSLRDLGGRQNCIYPRALEAHSVDLSKSCLQQARARPPGVAWPGSSTSSIFVLHKHTNQYVWQRQPKQGKVLRTRAALHFLVGACLQIPWFGRSCGEICHSDVLRQFPNRVRRLTVVVVSFPISIRPLLDPVMKVCGHANAISKSCHVSFRSWSCVPTLL